MSQSHIIIVGRNVNRQTYHFRNNACCSAGYVCNLLVRVSSTMKLVPRTSPATDNNVRPYYEPYNCFQVMCSVPNWTAVFSGLGFYGTGNLGSGVTLTESAKPTNSGSLAFICSSSPFLPPSALCYCRLDFASEASHHSFSDVPLVLLLVVFRYGDKLLCAWKSSPVNCLVGSSATNASRHYSKVRSQ